MKSANNIKIFIALAAILGSLLIPVNSAHSASCFAELTKAETKWIAMRDKIEMTSEFKALVTHHLRSAAELRHQGDIKGCLQQIESAEEKMNNKKRGG